MSREHPILFSAPMIRALLDGSKTQTRRICKSQPYSNGFHFDGHDILCHNDYLPPSAMLMDYREGGEIYTTSDMEGWGFCCPYGQPGDKLWVRETFIHIDDEGDKFDGMGSQTYYAASGNFEDNTRWLRERGLKWKPSIHMPRAASRILLEVVSVRVEQLQEISEADALAEGIDTDRMLERQDSYDIICAGTSAAGRATPQSMFGELWESINGAGSWDANLFVWVVEFKRVLP